MTHQTRNVCTKKERKYIYEMEKKTLKHQAVANTHTHTHTHTHTPECEAVYLSVRPRSTTFKRMKWLQSRRLTKKKLSFPFFGDDGRPRPNNSSLFFASLKQFLLLFLFLSFSLHSLTYTLTYTHIHTKKTHTHKQSYTLKHSYTPGSLAL